MSRQRTRRHLLAGVASGALVGTAGCLGVNLVPASRDERRRETLTRRNRQLERQSNRNEELARRSILTQYLDGLRFRDTASRAWFAGGSAWERTLYHRSARQFARAGHFYEAAAYEFDRAAEKSDAERLESVRSDCVASRDYCSNLRRAAEQYAIAARASAAGEDDAVERYRGNGWEFYNRALGYGVASSDTIREKLELRRTETVEGERRS